MSERTLSQIYRDFLKRTITEKAEALRHLAADLDRYAEDIDRVPKPGAPRFAEVVGRAQHGVLWGMANLSIDNLTTLAADADAALRGESDG